MKSSSNYSKRILLNFSLSRVRPEGREQAIVNDNQKRVKTRNSPNLVEINFSFCLLSPELLLCSSQIRNRVAAWNRFSGFQLNQRVALWVWTAQTACQKSLFTAFLACETGAFLILDQKSPYLPSPPIRLQLSFVCEEKLPMRWCLQKKQKARRISGLS